MKIAVQSGVPKAVDDLMESLSDTLEVDELTTTYGDGTFRVEEDKENILFKGTSPILHAARSGNLPVFKAVMKAMQSKLSQEKVAPHTMNLSFGYLKSRCLPAFNVHGS